MRNTRTFVTSTTRTALAVVRLGDRVFLGDGEWEFDLPTDPADVCPALVSAFSGDLDLPAWFPELTLRDIEMIEDAVSVLSPA